MYKSFPIPSIKINFVIQMQFSMQTTYQTESQVFKLYEAEKFTRAIGLNLEVKQRHPRAAYKLGPEKDMERGWMAHTATKVTANAKI